MRLISICLLVVGCIWATCAAWLFVGLAQVTERAPVTHVLLSAAGMLIGPLSLIAGSIVVLKSVRQRPGIMLISLGCTILTISVFHEVIGGIRPNPLEMRPPYLLYAIVLAITLLSDVGAVLLLWRKRKGLSGS